MATRGDAFRDLTHRARFIEEGMTFEFVDSPDSVHEMLERGLCDCIILDSAMDDLDTLEHVRRVRRTSDVPIIMHVTLGNCELAPEARAAGVNEIILGETALRNVEAFLSVIKRSVEDWRETRRKAVTIEVLQVLGDYRGREGALVEILGILRRYTGVDAVGIRLQEGHDYPYFVFDGFPDTHILKENSLCAIDLEGQLMRDEMGDPVLECMCGNVLRGRFDPSKPFFSEGGSFWTNSTTELLGSTSQEDLLTATRNTCNIEGYESVALIPIRHGGETMGLIQLNDTHPGRFHPEPIGVLEGLARSIALVLDGVDKEETLKDTFEHYRTIFDSVGDPIFIVDIDDFTIAESNSAALSWILEHHITPEADTCHGILAGRNVPCELHGDACPLLRMLETDESVSMIYLRFDGDGNSLYVEESAYPVRESGGEIVSSVLFVRDVTERKLAEQHLARYI
jgi:PAS domain-containing protein